MATATEINWVDAHAEAANLVMAGLAQSNADMVMAGLAAQCEAPDDLSQTEPPQTPAQARALRRQQNRLVRQGV